MTIHKVGNKGGKILRSGLSTGKSIIVPNTDIIQTPQTSKLKRALGRNVQASSGGVSSGSLVFFDSCSSATLPSQIINTVSPSYDTTNKRRISSTFDAGTYQTSALYEVGDIVYPRIEINTIGGTGDFIFRFYLNNIFAYQLYFQFNNFIAVYDKNGGLITFGSGLWNSDDYWQIIPTINASSVRFFCYELRGGNTYDSGAISHTLISVTNTDQVSWFFGCSPFAGYSYASILKD